MDTVKGDFLTVDPVHMDRDVHYFELNGLRVLLDVGSGSVHIIDQVTRDVLSALKLVGGAGAAVPAHLAEKYDPEEVLGVLAELASLKDQGLLFTGDTGLDIYQPKAGGGVKALCLHVAHDCNLRCRYCFAGTGAFGGQRARMPLSVAKAALDYLMDNSAAQGSCQVDFFGGEPLLNFEVVRGTVDYGRKRAAAAGKDIQFTLTTNAVLLDAKVERFLNEEDISVILSLDGRPEVNDALRVHSNGRGSYAEVLPNLLRFVPGRGGKSYYIRGTYTHFNRDFSGDVLHLADLGFEHISVEPVVASPGETYAFQPEDLPVLLAEYDRLVDRFLDREEQGRGFDFFHFNLSLESGPCLPKRLSGCGAGDHYLAVTPDGELYPCHQFVGQADYRMGDVYAGVTRKDIGQGFRDAYVFAKDTCRDCWARFFCGGGCHANAMAHNGSLLKPYHLGCQLQRKRLECALYIQISRAVKN
ncbi:MAG: thioether cross-link-forming SCIFF peptide maturase [Bacillota bacterium]